MLLSKSFLAALTACSAIATPIFDRRQSTYGSTKIHGVNIGGWLVLEPWITPSLFYPYNGAAIDEHTFCQNIPDAGSKLQQHWSTFASLGDFQKIAGNGFNLVRIPVGYWAFQKFPGDTYIQGAADYLEQAIGWARQTGLKVWIDLHGAPMSQNGYDNSGTRGNILWGTSDTVSFTEGVISNITSKYASSQYSDVVVGIELLNEPVMSALSGGRGTTQAYYESGAGTVGQSGSSTGVVIHDGFDNPSAWNGVLNGATIDHHEYQVFKDGDNGLSYQQHVDAVWSRIQEWGTGADKPIVCGEWTAAMTDCAGYLNGFGRGARYDGTYLNAPYVGSCATKSDIYQWDQGMKTATTNYISAQIQAYDKYLAGWIFWNFKTEGSHEWDLFILLDNGVWPKS